MAPNGSTRDGVGFRSAFAIGAGLLPAVAVIVAVRRIDTVLVVIVVAAFLAIGLDRPVTAMTRKGMRRGYAVAFLWSSACCWQCRCARPFN